MLKLSDVKKIAVLGSGLMGSGIAFEFLRNDFLVSLYDINDAALKKAGFRIDSLFAEFLAQEKIHPDRASSLKGNISFLDDLTLAVSDAQFVVEAVSEELALKQSLFTKIDPICSPDAIFATNTSGFRRTDIAKATKRPQQFIATHFWHPPYLIPLVEIGRADDTSDETVNLAIELMRRIGKRPIEMKKDFLGYIGTRLQMALLREALFCVEQGYASPEDVDVAVECSFGRRLPVCGPIKTADLGGLDIFYNAASYIYPDLCNAGEPPALFRQLLDSGKLGAKAGEGFFSWDQRKTELVSKKRDDLLMYFLKMEQFDAP